LLIDYHLGDIQPRGCTDDSVSTNRRALQRFARQVDSDSKQLSLLEVSEEVVEA
jgi:hypothetical protein